MLAIEINNLVKKFGKKLDFTAVDNVSFNIKTGEKVAIVGPNGAGKTTTLMMLLGLIKPTSGDAKIFGVPTIDRNVKALQNIGFCAGYANFRVDYSVFQILKSYALANSLENANQAVEEISTRLGITHLLKQTGNSLSSGQGTLVSVAKALIHKPKIAIMDEPTAFTDPDVSKRIQNILDEYNKDYGMSIVITSHDMVEVERICDRVIFISHGKVALDASTETLLEKTGFSNLEEAWLKFAKDNEEDFNQTEKI